MISRLVVAMVFAAAAGLVVQNLPDIARYLKIKSM